MELEIIRYPSDILRKTTVEVKNIDGEIAELAKNMVETLAGKGVGLAGPQVGRDIKIFVAQDENGKVYTFINPEITGTSIETGPYEEGCLSLPGVYEDVIRPLSVQIQAWNEKGKFFKMECTGLLGRVVQHENDHLKGVLFFDYLNDMKKEKLLKLYQKKLKQ